MREVTPETAADYLIDTGRVPPGRAIRAAALGWGVSNLVMRVEVEGEPPWVLKQSRERLRTEAHWVSRLDRIWTETDALELLGTLLPPGAVPEVLFKDEPNYLFAMTCAPDDSVVWKEQLLAGQVDPAVARRAGTYLGTIHAETVGHPGLTGRLRETIIFDQLRIDPYYRTIARAHPDLAGSIDDLIARMAAPETTTLVHADYSPKNMLVHSRGLTLVDFETAHAGDPAFDLGFFLSHLVLKGFRAGMQQGAGREAPYLDLTRTFWAAYRDRDAAGGHPERASRAARPTAACMLARVDGKSPVDYLDDRSRAAVRRFARGRLAHGRDLDGNWDDFLRLAVREMHSGSSERGI